MQRALISNYKSFTKSIGTSWGQLSSLQVTVEKKHPTFKISVNMRDRGGSRKHEKIKRRKKNLGGWMGTIPKIHFSFLSEVWQGLIPVA